MTPQEEIRFRQMMANQMSARQPMLRDQMPDMDPNPLRALPIATPTPRNPLEEAARFRGLLGPAINYRPPYSREEIERLMRDEEINRVGPTPPGSYTPPMSGYQQSGPPITPEESARLSAETAAREDYIRRRNEGYEMGAGLVSSDPTREEIEYRKRESERLRGLSINPDTSPGSPPLSPIGGGVAADPEPEEYDGFVDSGTGRRGYLDFKYMPTPLSPMGGEVATAPEPEEYDGFVDSGTGQRGYLDFKYMPTPMDQAAPVAMASTAYNAPPVANTAYMPPPTDAPVNTAYNAPPVANTAYMPSRRTVPVDTTYRPPASANTTYMPSSAPTYGMSSTPSYGMSNAQTTTPTYGGQIREPSYSPNQAGKYKVDGPRLKNTGGLFNDLNAFFGRPQT